MKTTHDIVAGGGWKTPREYSVKVKAICVLVLALAAAIFSPDFAERWGAWVFAIPALLFVFSLVLFCIERTSRIPGFPNGDHDLRNLYAKKSDVQKDKLGQ